MCFIPGSKGSYSSGQGARQGYNGEVQVKLGFDCVGTEPYIVSVLSMYKQRQKSTEHRAVTRAARRTERNQEPRSRWNLIPSHEERTCGLRLRWMGLGSNRTEPVTANPYYTFRLAPTRHLVLQCIGGALASASRITNETGSNDLRPVPLLRRLALRPAAGRGPVAVQRTRQTKQVGNVRFWAVFAGRR